MQFPVERAGAAGGRHCGHFSGAAHLLRRTQLCRASEEMGGDGREQPFFFIKSAHALVPNGGEVRYPPKTSNYHYETELVVALAKGGRRIDAKRASEHGYAVGLDMTRDLQQWGKDHGRPWDFGKDFDQAAPCGSLVPVAKIGHPARGAIWLTVNGKQRQRADLGDMIWSVPSRLRTSPSTTRLSRATSFIPAPAGVGPVKPGDEMHAGIDGVGELKVKILPAL